MAQLPSITTTTKTHFPGLDGLRGVAAIAIVLFHFMEWVYADPRQNFIAHGFLAVDFFFCLSGFVIAYAYDDQLTRLGLATFIKRRLIRLHPLVIFGSLLGLVGFLFDPFAPQPSTSSPLTVGLTLISSLCLIPLPISQERAFNLFSFNAPAWSLFWEYVASIAYALLLYRLRRRYLAIAILPAAVLLCWVSYRAGNLLGGWSGPTFWDGGARVAYSFLVGVFFWRSKWSLPNRFGLMRIAGLLLVAFVWPSTPWNGVVEPLIVLLYFPVLIVVGAGARLSPSQTRLCGFLGKLSYPLYMTHYGAMWIFGHYVVSHQPDRLQLSVLVGVGMGVSIGFAYLVERVYDAPIRRYLSGRL